MQPASLPLFSLLSDIYPASSLPFQKDRYQALISKFEEIYKMKPCFVARAPGRVNLIGEHIDYMGFGVLPFALELDTLMAFCTSSSSTIELSHMDSLQFPSASLPLSPSYLPSSDKSYFNYFLAGYRSVLAPLNLKESDLKGLNVLITGNVPIAAGLSSSAAMVVCSAALTLYAYNLQDKIPLKTFTENAILYERQLGTAVGGMDQTISIMGQMNKALYITFNPIEATEVPLPTNVTFYIGDSMTQSAKILTVGTHYNKRVCECRLALRIIMKKKGITKKLANLKELMEYLNRNFEEMGVIVKECLKEGGYTKEELQKELETDLENALGDIMHWQLVLDQNSSFFLQERALHVYAEASRVLQFKSLCNTTPPSLLPPLLANLLNASHNSCKVLYDCSSPKLNEFIDVALDSGALGCRLTGAGWGGCAVAMVENNKADRFEKEVQEKFYGGEKERVWKSSLGRGAGVMKVEGVQE